MELRIVIAASALAVAGLVLAGLSAAALGAARAAAKWPAADQPALGVVPARIGVVAGVVLCGAAAGLGGSMSPVAGRWAWLGIIAGAAIVAVVLVSWAAAKLASKIELSALINSPSPMGGKPQGATPAVPAQPPVVMGPPVTAVSVGHEIAYGQPYPGMVEVSTPPRGVPSPVALPTGSPAAPPAVLAGDSPGDHPDTVHTTTPDSAAPATQSAEPPAPATEAGDPLVPAEALPGWVYTDTADDWYLVASIPDGRRLLRLHDFTIVPPGAAAGPLRLAGSVEMTVWPADTEPSEPDDTANPV